MLCVESKLVRKLRDPITAHQINLACMRLKAGVSGIAGFFDDSLGEFLGLPEGHIVTYITLIGDPMPGE